MRLAIGTFTDHGMGGEPGRGITLARFDRDSGQFTVEGLIEGGHSPSFLCRHPRLPVIYAAERRLGTAPGAEGAVAAWNFCEGQPKLLGRFGAGGAFTAHVECHPEGSLLCLANPLGPSISLVALAADGEPVGLRDIFTAEGTGSLPRQEAPWPHSGFWDLNGTHLFTCDLGLDRVQIFRCNGAAPVLQPARLPFAQLNSGAGARHLAVAPDNRFVYVVGELDSSITVFAFDAGRSSLAVVQCRPSTPDGYTGINKPAEAKLSGDGRHLYVTNRGHNSIGVFDVDAATGRITPVDFTPCGGAEPRHIALSRDGEVLFLANQVSGDLRAFARSADSGRLEGIGEPLALPSPTCVLPLD